MTAAAELKQNATRIKRVDLASPILVTSGSTAIAIRAGTIIESKGHTYAFDADTPVTLGQLAPGQDYGISLDQAGKPFADILGPPNPLDEGWFAGFHYAPGGCATGKAGGDAIHAINPHSLWDIGFRPTCPDPRGMALVETKDGGRFWADIYLLGVDHHEHGTSRSGETIADGRDLPMRLEGTEPFNKLDFATATEIYTLHGKRLLGAEEFFAAAYGVKERCSRDNEPTRTGALDDGAERFISKYGLFDVTGTMWQWGTDGHPDDPRPSLFGGSWVLGSNAGSRYAPLDYWPGDSSENISARGGSDHLNLA
ncbi:hypothetical protein G6L46_10385 [Agrobacterium rhizogenes]|uniref:phage major tropism determinant n=1 Tax=Rhizobium rhizogenes TaxID=359 RepID=UPI00157243FF|nr:hypothetical protein [Rhizobium rhizogenes]NTF87531.1 hypothetical protein [Rhizobium rhizogenes]